MIAGLVLRTCNLEKKITLIKIKTYKRSSATRGASNDTIRAMNINLLDHRTCPWDPKRNDTRNREEYDRWSRKLHNFECNFYPPPWAKHTHMYRHQRHRITAPVTVGRRILSFLMILETNIKLLLTTIVLFPPPVWTVREWLRNGGSASWEPICSSVHVN